MKKKNRNRSGIVYSTDSDFNSGYDKPGRRKTLPPAQQNLRIRLDRLKGNKVATIVYDFVGNDDDLKDLGKMLKSACGTGGSAKNGEVILQGDFRKKIDPILTKAGYKFKFVGG